MASSSSSSSSHSSCITTAERIAPSWHLWLPWLPDTHAGSPQQLLLFSMYVESPVYLKPSGRNCLLCSCHHCICLLLCLRMPRLKNIWPEEQAPSQSQPPWLHRVPQTPRMTRQLPFGPHVRRHHAAVQKPAKGLFLLQRSRFVFGFRFLHLQAGYAFLRAARVASLSAFVHHTRSGQTCSLALFCLLAPCNTDGVSNTHRIHRISTSFLAASCALTSAAGAASASCVSNL